MMAKPILMLFAACSVVAIRGDDAKITTANGSLHFTVEKSNIVGIKTHGSEEVAIVNYATANSTMDAVMAGFHIASASAAAREGVGAVAGVL